MRGRRPQDRVRLFHGAEVRLDAALECLDAVWDKLSDHTLGNDTTATDRLNQVDAIRHAIYQLRESVRGAE